MPGIYTRTTVVFGQQMTLLNAVDISLHYQWILESFWYEKWARVGNSNKN